MERMIIKHLSGSKANQIEEFAIKHHNELTFGRDPSSIVKFDADRDDLVGRSHAKIERDPNNERGFLLSDTGSRNGTFVNDKKISGTINIVPGDIVQFGPGGPKFQFDVEPRPNNTTKPTRIVETGGQNTPATRIVETGISASAGASDSFVTTPAAKTSVGKATVERMISHNVAETRQQERSNFAMIGGAAAVAVLVLFGVVIGGAYWYSSSQKQDLQSQIASQTEDAKKKAAEMQKALDEEKANSPKAAADIAEKNEKSVVFIQLSWQLVNSQSKSQIYHQYIPNSKEFLSKELKTDFGKGELVPNGQQAVPVFVQVEGSHEPFLTDEKNDWSVPIGGSGTGSGFIVTTDGYILTNRHVAAPYRARYTFPDEVGVMITTDGKLQQVKPPQDWIPEKTTAVPRQYQKAFEGDIKLRVQLPGSDNPIDAQFTQSSPRHDVAMIKLSVPGAVPKIEMFDNYDSIKKGEGLVIMGYPGDAPRVFTRIVSQDQLLSPGQDVTIIPDPTVSITSVGNVVRNSKENDPDKRFSEAGDVIRYQSGLTFGGNSGGPVFDMQGKVIGIHYAGDNGRTGWAVPIRYGMELFPGGQAAN